MVDPNKFANQVLDCCESTNDLAKKLAENGVPHGTWVSARMQTSGRGRLGRKWEAMEGNLFLSVVARIKEKSVWSWVPLASAIAITRCLRAEFPKLDFQVKWPNDLHYQESKLGGILCEGTGRGKDTYIVIGIGLNCVRSPEDLDQATTDLAQIVSSKTGEKISISTDSLRLKIIEALLEELRIFETEGPGRVIESYRQWAALPHGTRIEWGVPPQEGWVEGLGDLGQLQVLAQDGTLVQLFADDVKVKIGRKHSIGSRAP